MRLSWLGGELWSECGADEELVRRRRTRESGGKLGLRFENDLKGGMR